MRESVELLSRLPGRRLEGGEEGGRDASPNRSGLSISPVPSCSVLSAGSPQPRVFVLALSTRALALDVSKKVQSSWSLQKLDATPRIWSDYTTVEGGWRVEVGLVQVKKGKRHLFPGRTSVSGITPGCVHLPRRMATTGWAWQAEKAAGDVGIYATAAQ